MKVNPMNVIKLLLATFQIMQIPESPVNKNEVELAENFENILLVSMDEVNALEVINEASLDFQETFKNYEVNAVEDDIWYKNEKDSDTCSVDREELSQDYKRKAVEFWRSGKMKKNLSIKTVQRRFKLVSSDRQLRRWAHQLNKGGTYKEKLIKISEFVLQNLRNAIDSGFIIHDIDLRKWALEAKKELEFHDVRFKASDTWLYKFKKVHRIVSRKINKFVTKTTIEHKETVNEECEKFIAEVVPYIKQYGPENTYNADQSGFQFEIHSGRTLTEKGKETVECVVQSISSTTHSYTVVPTVNADGKLLSPLFLILKESNDEFGPIVQQNLFLPDNVYVMASKSGKMTTDHFKTWLEKIFFPNIGQNSILLLDSWSGHCTKVVEEIKPSSKNLKLFKIPKGATGKIQPLDVFGFRVWKNFIRHFSDSVILMNYDINLHLRNNVIKLQSLTHNQLSSPRYVNLFKQGWFQSGYINERPENFDNPVTFGFESCQAQCEIPGCNNVAILKCSWCQKSLCFKHFFEDFHYCNSYNP